LLGLLAILARDGALSENEAAERSEEARTSVRRRLKLLEERSLVSHKSGERGAKLFDVTEMGLYFCFVQHYLTSKEFVNCIAKHSRLISILMSTGDASLEKLIDETAKLTWKMAYYESIQSVLTPNTAETDSAEDAAYFDILRGVRSVETLEWTLLTTMLERVGPGHLKQAMQRLSEKEKAELRSKLIEARDSYVSSRNVLNHIIDLLNRTVRVHN
jgi:hypothetical protein